VGVGFAEQAAAAAQDTLNIDYRQHADHALFPALPQGSGDESFGLSYDFHDQGGFWRLGVQYTSSPSGGTNAVESVLTPHLTLIFEDDFWRGGVGILYSMIELENGEDETLDLYYQLVLGISIPLGTWDLEIYTYHVFEDWDVVDEFDTDELEFGAVLKLDL
jgi:hypothetical protein